jgi:fermentation-respiration switch protein FrsA (DUF1100 family)
MRREIAFPSQGLQCRGWLDIPDDLPKGARAPTIVMAHGFGAVKEMYLDQFAERFVAAGFVTLVFDYRYLGESEGQPRSQVLPQEQREDYRNAITWVSRQTEVDPERIGIWGTSYSGGHVMHLGAFEPRIRAVVAQVPMISGWRQILHSGGRESVLGLLAMVTADRVARSESGTINYIKVIAPPGEPAALGSPDAYDWFTKMADRVPATWRNEVTLESIEKLVEYDPTGPIELISPTPLLMILAEHDSLIPLEVAREAFSRAGDPKELLVLPCTHFEVYDTEPWFSRASTAAAEWFKTHLARAA